MGDVPVPVPPVPLAELLAALQALAPATEPPLTEPGAPVRPTDLPPVWRAYLHDLADSFADLVPLVEGEIRCLDWTRLLARLGRHIEMPYRTAEILALVERGPTAEDLDCAPLLSPWMLALAMGGAPVVAWCVTGHPKLGGSHWCQATWAHQSGNSTSARSPP